MTTFFKIGAVDWSSYIREMKVDYETIVSDSSGRNSQGTMVYDVIAEKRKVTVTFRSMLAADMNTLLTSLRGVSNYTLSISYLDPQSGTVETMSCYHGTPSPEYYTIQDNFKLCNEMEVSFVEI